MSGSIKSFEEIDAWKEARKLVGLVYKAIKTNENFGKDYRLVQQIQAAAVSTMSNIAEGFSRRGNKEFIQFLFISKSSAAEVQSCLYVALDQEYMTKDDFNQIYKQANIVAKLNSGFIKYLKSQLDESKQTH